MRIQDLLDRSRNLYGDKAAVSVAGAGSWTYGELHQRVRQLACGMAAIGVKRQDRVAILSRNGITYHDLYLVCAYLGAIAVPVNTTLAPPEASHILHHSDPALVVVDGPFGSLVDQAPPGIPVLDVESSEYRGLLGHEISDSILSRAFGDDVALMIYTSGTTGRPKGVCLSQHALAFNGMSIAISQQLVHDDVFLSSTPLYHAASGTRVYTMLLDGQTHVILPSFNIDSFLQVLNDYLVTTTVVVPTQLQRMLDSFATSALNLEALRLLVYGAAPTAIDIVEKAAAELPCGLHQGYGLTEAVTNLTALMPEDHRKGNRDLLRSCGKPVATVDLRLVGENGEPAPTGEVGEIVVSSEKIMAGYWRDEDATRSTITEGWLYTGDLGRFDQDGYLYIAGRAKDMLISGGVNIYPSEVEEVLLSHPSIIEAAVVGAPHDEWGEVPVVFVVSREGFQPDENELISWCEPRLSRLKIPRSFEMVTDLPRTATGKVRKVELKDGLRKIPAPVESLPGNRS